MSNLGWYQIMTTVAKKCGGPLKLFGLVAGGGILVGALGTKAVDGVAGSVKNTAAKKKKAREQLKIYNVCEEGVSNEGLQFHVGDTFKVLERDGNAVLIEKIGDSNNPYFVASDFLNKISDYKLSAE